MLRQVRKPRGSGDPRLGRRAGQGQDQQRVGDLRGLRTEQRDRLAAPQQLEIPVSPQRNGLSRIRPTRRDARAATLRANPMTL